jgi:hypothetical protein
MLSTNAQQNPTSAVLDVDVTQSISQKARGVGNIRVHLRRPHGIELQLRLRLLPRQPLTPESS